MGILELNKTQKRPEFFFLLLMLFLNNFASTFTHAQVSRL